MGKGRLARARLRMPRLTWRVLICTVGVSALLGGGTAGDLMSIGGTPAHPARARSAAQPSGQVSPQIDPGGPIIIAPDPSPAPVATTAPPPLPSPARLTPPTPPPPPVGAAALAQISYPWQQL